MAYQATVFNVMIASPGDVQVERNLVREVVHEWNAIHSNSRRMVLQPLGWETHSHPSMEGRAQGVLNKQILEISDLLVAIFWTRIGSPTGESPSGTVEEIEKHLEAGKPAMIYFSSAPVRPDSVDDKQYRVLTEFKETCKKRGLIEMYDDPTDFRQTFARHLATIVNSNSYFSVADESSSIEEIFLPDRKIPQLTQEARSLLLEAVNDRDGTILHVRYMGGVDIQTNGKQFIERGNARSRAAWEGAIEELQSFGLIEDLSYKGEVFQVTRIGYAMAETLRT